MMKRLDRLILKSFLGPLLLTFAIAVFVLLMQFVWKYVDDLVGKGLPFGIIAELLFYASATCVPMALPIAVLFASIMTMGNFGEKYELVAMKAGGVSLARVMAPMLMVVLLLTGVAFYFSNNVLPIAMNKYKVLLFDVTRKKPALNIKPSEYYTDLDGYVIRVDSKNPNDGSLKGIVIYDHTQRLTQTNVVVADHGKMQTSPDEHYLIFTLYDGNMYTEEIDGENRETRPLTSIAFKEQVMTFDMSSFAFDQTNEDFFSGNYQMMNVSQLREKAHALEEGLEKRYADCAEEGINRFQAFRSTSSDSVSSLPQSVVEEEMLMMGDSALAAWSGLEALQDAKRIQVTNKARELASSASNQAQMFEQIVKSDEEYINRHYIEMHRKYTLSVACLVMFLVGAPFGSIVRKGGLGLPLVASVLFFVIYYVIGMIAEKSVRESAMGPIGMWISTFVLLPIGVILTLHSTTDGNYLTPGVLRSKLGKQSSAE